MKTKKHYPILAVAAVILCVSALGEVRLPLPEDRRPILIGRPNPEFRGIHIVHVTILPSTSEPNKHSLVWKELKTKVEHKLEEAGIKIIHTLDTRYESRSFHVPELRIYIDMLKLEGLQQYVYRIKTSLSRVVYLALRDEGVQHFEPKFMLKADVWKTGSPMQAISVKNMPAVVTDVVLEQVDAFIAAYCAANPPGARPSAPNDITVKPEKLTKPDAKRAVAQYKYVASKNSKVFHKPDCRWVKRIKPANLVGYNSRGEAIEAGKRPCKMCKP